MKNILNRITKGIREANNIDLTPKEFQKINSLKFVKIFKFLGIFSTSVILSSKFQLLKTYNIYDLNNEILYLSMFFSIIYIIYRLIFNFFVLKKIFFIFKNKEYEVLNSPKDILATVLKAGFIALKGVGGVTVSTGLLFTMGNEMDDIAESYGRKRVFGPALNNGIEKLGLKNKVESLLDQIGFHKIDLKKLTEEERNKLIKQTAEAWNVPEEYLKISIDSLVNRRESLDEGQTKDVLKSIEENSEEKKD